MTVKIRVRNFQSIRDGQLEVKGLTALTGPNNSGKSALMRAVRGVFQNPPAANYIRHGTSGFDVTLEFDDGRSLSWQREKKPCYVIDGGDPIYPGRGIPDEVKAFGVQSITAGGSEVWPTIAPQFTGQVFLLDQPGSALAEAVSDVERVSKLNGALRACESDKRATQASLKVRRDDEVRLADQLAAFDGLDDLDAEVTSLEVALAQATKIGQALVLLTSLRDRLRAAQAEIQRLAPVADVNVPTSSEVQEVRDLWSSLKETESLRHRFLSAWGAVGRLEDVEKVAVPDAAPTKALLQGCDVVKGLAARLQVAKATVGRLAGVEGIKVGVEDLDRTKFDRFLAAISLVEGFQARRQDGLQAVADLEAELAAKEAEAAEAAHEVHEILGGLPECPTCGRDLS